MTATGCHNCGSIIRNAVPKIPMSKKFIKTLRSNRELIVGKPNSSMKIQWRLSFFQVGSSFREFDYKFQFNIFEFGLFICWLAQGKLFYNWNHWLQIIVYLYYNKILVQNVDAEYSKEVSNERSWLPTTTRISNKFYVGDSVSKRENISDTIVCIYEIYLIVL